MSIVDTRAFRTILLVLCCCTPRTSTVVASRERPPSIQPSSSPPTHGEGASRDLSPSIHTTRSTRHVCASRDEQIVCSDEQGLVFEMRVPCERHSIVLSSAGHRDRLVVICEDGSSFAAFVDDTPREFQPLHTRLRDLAPGRGHVCSIDEERAVVCVGENNRCQLGSPDQDLQRTRPQLGPVVQIVSGIEYSCALDDLHRLWCWGQMASADWCEPEIIAESVSTAVGTPTGVCLLSIDGVVSCYGIPTSMSPTHDARTDPLGDLRARALHVSDDAVCAIRSEDGSLWCRLDCGGSKMRVSAISSLGYECDARLVARNAETVVSGDTVCWLSGDEFHCVSDGSMLQNVIEALQ